jgi:hypothetical protein
MARASPPDLAPANPVIIGHQVDDDITSSWFIVARDPDDACLTIDLHPSRLGRCYDSFWDRHGIPGSCPVIASSFTDLLRLLLANQGAHWHWLQPGFESLGDAYEQTNTPLHP